MGIRILTGFILSNPHLFKKENPFLNKLSSIISFKYFLESKFLYSSLIINALWSSLVVNL